MLVIPAQAGISFRQRAELFLQFVVERPLAIVDRLPEDQVACGQSGNLGRHAHRLKRLDLVDQEPVTDRHDERLAGREHPEPFAEILQRKPGIESRRTTGENGPKASKRR